MEDLLRFLENYEVSIYILLGMVGVLYLRKLFLSLQEWRASCFGLERESAQRRLSSAMTVVVLLGLLGFAEFFLVSFVSPAYPRERLLPTPTLDLLATPTPSLEPFTTQDASLLGAMATPVVSEEQGCIAGQLEWIAPLSGDEISGSVELMGTVNMADLSFYKYEFAPAGSDTWETIAAGDSTRIEENLGGEGSLWYIGDKTPGDYQLRIVAINRQNVALPACTISVRIVAPES